MRKPTPENIPFGSEWWWLMYPYRTVVSTGFIALVGGAKLALWPDCAYGILLSFFRQQNNVSSSALSIGLYNSYSTFKRYLGPSISIPRRHIDNSQLHALNTSQFTLRNQCVPWCAGVAVSFACRTKTHRPRCDKPSTKIEGASAQRTCTGWMACEGRNPAPGQLIRSDRFSGEKLVGTTSGQSWPR